MSSLSKLDTGSLVLCVVTALRAIDNSLDISTRLIMVLEIDGKSEMGEHVHSKLCNI